MNRSLTTVLAIVIAVAIIGFFVVGLMQRPEIDPGITTKTDEVATEDPPGATNVDSETPATAVATATAVAIATAVEEPESTEEPATPQSAPAPTEDAAEEPTENGGAVPTSVVTYGYEVVATYPHDRKAFLQGLVWMDNIWYEGTGLYGESTLRKVEPETGEVIQQIAIDDSLFGEGITIFNDKIYQLTWKAQRGFVYDKESFELVDEFTYPTEGWGITHDGERLIMSDGTPTIYFWDPETLEEIGSITVTNQGQPVRNLNELEYIDGLIYANVWQTPFIVMINPESGQVEGVLALDDLLKPADLNGPVDVLNGIAYDAEQDRLFVSGKLWPKIFEIKLIENES